MAYLHTTPAHLARGILAIISCFKLCFQLLFVASVLMFAFSTIAQCSLRFQVYRVFNPVCFQSHYIQCFALPPTRTFRLQLTLNLSIYTHRHNAISGIMPNSFCAFRYTRLSYFYKGQCPQCLMQRDTLHTLTYEVKTLISPHSRHQRKSIFPSPRPSPSASVARSNTT